MPGVRKHHAFPIGWSCIPAGFAKAFEYWEAIPVQHLCSLLVCNVWAQRLLARTALTQPSALSPIDCSREWDPVQSQCSPLLSSALHTHTHLGRKTVPSVMFNCCFLDGYLGAGILVAEGWFAQGSALMEKAAGYAAPHAVFGPSIPSLPCLCPRAVAQHWSQPHPQGAFLKSWWPVQGILVHLISS